MKLKNTLKYLLNIGIKKEETEERNILYIRLINQYTIILSIIFLLHSLHNFFISKTTCTGYFMLAISLFFLSTLFFKQIRKYKFNIFLIFIFLSGVIFFYEAYLEMEAGIFLYYFPLAVAIPFFFNYTTDKKYVNIISITIITLILINIITDRSLFINQNETSSTLHKSIFIMSFLFSAIMICINLIFIFKKKENLFDLHKIAMEKESLLKQQQKLLDTLPSEISPKKIKELTELAVNNSPSFFSAFSETYPTFFPELLKISSDLSITELELCAFIKLNFSTKDIARNTRLSTRAIEGRKYRLRKKLNFNSDKELVLWMLNFNFSTNTTI